MPASLAVVVFDGLAYGMLLFLISVGLSVTMGLMNFINLAHGAFAMLGGYLCVALMQSAGIPFLLTLPLVFVAVAAVGAALEVSLYRRLYRSGHLEQLLFTIGLTFMAVAAATWLFGPQQQPVQLPDMLRGQVAVAGVELGAYRLFLLAFGAVLTVLLAAAVTRTRFGAQVRAAVDNEFAARGMGIHVDRVFLVAFSFGCGLAGLGGALAIDVLGLDPTFPLKYLVYFLIVVAVGGAGTIKGPFAAALVLGVADVAGKYYVPQIGAFIIYAVMVALLLARPAGLFGLVRR
ncbi:MAG TPA: branched-chain amino acid ABC transporter permease [Burkholderiales bacterium]|nr:branched-chain amino acid ABC transporter permease [Burkholderiales bacterium]